MRKKIDRAEKERQCHLALRNRKIAERSKERKNIQKECEDLSNQT